MKFKLTLFVIYTLLYELMVIGGFMYVVFFMGYNPWFLLLMVVMSGSQLKPKSFGLWEVRRDN